MSGRGEYEFDDDSHTIICGSSVLLTFVDNTVNVKTL